MCFFFSFHRTVCMLTFCTIILFIHYSSQEGKFYLTDRRSSNGTMVYLQDPFPLPYQHSLKLRMGRTNLSLQVRVSFYIFCTYALHVLHVGMQSITCCVIYSSRFDLESISSIYILFYFLHLFVSPTFTWLCTN